MLPDLIEIVPPGGKVDATVVLPGSKSITNRALILAALGELVTERSGVLNLGVEGMMLVGAVTGFIVTIHTGSATLGSIRGSRLWRLNASTPKAAITRK